MVLEGIFLTQFQDKYFFVQLIFTGISIVYLKAISILWWTIFLVRFIYKAICIWNWIIFLHFKNIKESSRGQTLNFKSDLFWKY